ncbi:YncE family protein [Mucilaginibacter sp. X4EP1]|uniref:YncE family protein n=1 Tax=Mucilaginibacter sp. X4EP1 TaxID=2723092 RepID=UPI002167D6BA|nr:YncE family protein [Mucilaginibacter sp. X4EP1]MCS3812917.1 outer membrane protein assembly factor BamB [Mucilaginibacter sp. X4EP1]
MKKIITLAAIFSTVLVTAASAQNKPEYHIIKTFHINSAGGYDYTTVDSASNRLYLSHGTQVNVLDKTTGDSIAVIATDKDVHGIALVHDLGKGYITNGSANSVLVFDLATFKVLAHVPAGTFADGILYDDYSKKIISCNGRSKNMTVIDPVTDKAIATIQLTGWPETATSDGKGKIYVNNAEKSEIDVIDATTFKVINSWPIAPGKSASGLAIDRSTMRLFAGCDNSLLIVMDATNGKVVASLPIGDECDAVGFDKKLKTVYSSNGDGTLTIIKELPDDKFTVVQNLKTLKGARTNAVDQLTHLVYLPTAEFVPKKPGQFRPAAIPGTFKVLVVGK